MFIGQKIRALRQERKMKLIDLAEKTGVQIATLSRMEHGKMTGTLSSHIKIAKALQVELTDLYKDLVESQRLSPDLKTPSKPQVETASLNTKVSLEMLTTNVLNKKMAPVMLLIDPGGKTKKEKEAPGSEKFLFVIKGKVAVKIGDELFRLKTNDSLYFDASIPYSIANQENTGARVLSITTPVSL